MSSERFLSIYLNDHLAGSTAGVELAKRAAANNKESSLGTLLSQLARDIESDRQSLETLMGEMGFQKDVLKGALAWAAERIGRLKMNGQVSGYSDLSRVVELEWIRLGVEGKLTLWRTLMQVRDKYPALTEVDLEELERRAERQRSLLDEAHKDAVARAL